MSNMSDSLLLASYMIAALVILLPLLFHLTKYLGASSDNVRKNEPVLLFGGLIYVYKSGILKWT